MVIITLIPPETKPCIKCGTVYPLLSFAKHSHGLLGRADTCRPCVAKAKAIHQFNQEMRKQGLHHCYQCDQWLPLDSYYPAHGKKFRASRCKACTSGDPRLYLETQHMKSLGKRHCRTCKQWLDPSSFYTTKRGSGFQCDCKQCHRQLAHKNRNLLKHRESRRRYIATHKTQIAIEHHRRRAVKRKAAGIYTVEQWKALLETYNGRCLACGSTENITIDHIIPLVSGGTNDISNLQPLCRSCNSKKHTKTIDYR